MGIALLTANKMLKISANVTNDLLKTLQLLKHHVTLEKQLIQSGVVTVCQNHSELEMLEVHSTHKINVTNNSMDMIKLNAAVSTQTDTHMISMKMIVVV